MKQFQLPQDVETLLQKLNEAGFEAFLVGGCVRDMLMGIEPQDYDITTDAGPQQIKNVYRDFHIIETGLKHGTLTIRFNHASYEITTYRSESSYADHRHPDSIFFSKSLTEDLKRRDFSINSMAYSPLTGLIDPYDGQGDLKRQLIRCVGDPEDRFNEDALRILRCLRFASRYGFDIESGSKEALFRLKDTLKLISAERVAAEVNEILCSDGIASCLREYRDIFTVFIPELAAMFDYDQHCKYHCHDLWEHTIQTVSLTKKDVATRWAALLHDLGKPAVKTADENGECHFYDHPAVSEQLARVILSRLKFSNDLKKEICFLIKYHDYPLESRKAIKKILNLSDLHSLEKLLDLKRADNHATEPLYHLDAAYFQNILKTAQEILEAQEAFRISDLKVNGRHLLELGVERTRIASVLKELLEQVISDELKNEYQELSEYVRENFL